MSDKEVGFATRAIHAGQDADPATGATVVPIYATSHLHPGRPGPAQGLRVLAAAATRRGPPWRRAWRPWKAASAAWPSPPGWRRRRPCCRCCGPATRSRPRPTSTAAPSACSSASSSRGAWSPATPTTPAPAGFAKHHHAEDQARLDRDADQPAAANPRHRGHRRAGPQGRGACWRSTTRSPRRTCSSRSRSGPTSSSTARRSTSAAIPTWSAARVVGRARAAGADRVLPERGRRRAGAVRRLPDAARPQDAGRAHGAALRQRPPAGRRGWRRSRRCEQVYYPGLPTHPGHDAGEAADARLRRHDQRCGSRAAAEAARRFMTRTKLFSLAESLGGVESLVCHPATMTHASIPVESRASRAASTTGWCG